MQVLIAHHSGVRASRSTAEIAREVHGNRSVSSVIRADLVKL